MAVQLAGFAICAAAIALVMRKMRPEAATVLVIAAGLLAMTAVLPLLGQMLAGVKALAQRGGLQEEYMSSLLKIAGISLLMEFAAQTCRDAGEDSLAVKVELAGRIMLIVLALPVMDTLLAQVLSLSL